MSVLHELEMELENHRRLILTTLVNRDGGLETLLSVESRNLNPIVWQELTDSELTRLGTAINLAILARSRERQ